MLGLIMILCAIIIMYKVADSEGRSGVLWGAATFVLCLLSAMFIPLPFTNIIIGLVLCYGVMFTLKLLDK